MFNRLLPIKYHHKCPDYQGFSLIDVKPNESYVEPIRATNRLRKGLAMLIYAQQWFVQALGEGSVEIYTKDIANSVTRVLEILGDKNAIWNSKGEKMRPIHVLLDLFGAVYLRLNDLQNDIKALAGQSIRVAQDKSTRQMIRKDVFAIKSSLKDILAVMESMPRHKSAGPQRASTKKRRGFPKVEFSDESETDDELFTDGKFGILLANASEEELGDLRRKAERTRMRSRRRSHLYSVGTLDSEDEPIVDVQHELCDPPAPEKSYAPFRLSLSDAALQRFSGAARVDSLYHSYRDVPLIEHDEPSAASPNSVSTLPVLSEHGERLEFPSCPKKFFLTRQRPRSFHAVDSLSEMTTELTGMVERSTQPGDFTSIASSDASLVRHDSSLEAHARTLIRTDQHTEWDSASEERSRLCSNAEDESKNPYYSHSEYNDLDEELAAEDRISRAVYTTATKVVMSRSTVQEQPYCRPVVLQKNRRSIHRQSRLSETRLRSFHKEDFMTDHSGASFDYSDVESSFRSSMPDSAIYSASDSMSSTQGSPVAPSNKFSDMLVLPELIAVHSEDDCDEESSWTIDVTGLLCLDKSKVYSLAKVAELQQHFGARLEKVVIKASKDELSSRFRPTTEIAHDGQVWRVQQ